MDTLPDYQQSNSELWQGRPDALPNEHFYQQVHCQALDELASSEQFDYALLGFACDAGVTRNNGRKGAKQGPQQIRKSLANLAMPELLQEGILDGGDIHCHHDELESAQQQLSEAVCQLQSHCHNTIVLGGGHEVAYGHFLGLQNAYPDEDIAIINFDAHFDMRPYDQLHPASSGTPFLQIAKECQNKGRQFHYLTIGIQPFANSVSLFDRAIEYGVDTILADTVRQNIDMAFEVLYDFLDIHERIYLTICLDVFQQSIAPGVSAPQINGLTLEQFIPLLKPIVMSQKIISFDIAELNPLLDRDDQTARLAAYLIQYIIQYDYRLRRSS